MNRKKNDNKGNWEYSFFQKVIIPNEEQNIKFDLRPENSFDIKKIHQYLNPTISKEELIENKFNSLGKLSKSEMIIYNNYKSKKELEFNKDLEEIKKYGVKAKVTSKEGKIHFLFYLLDGYLKIKSISNIFQIYLKFFDYEISDKYKKTYKKQTDDMNLFLQDYNLIELQFTHFYRQMPPLNNIGFKEFDDWQKNIIYNIDNNISTLVSAPTSAGKTILSGYASSKGRTLYIVPTDALAWQVASYIGYIINADVPIITLTYMSNPKRDEFINMLNHSQAIIGTPVSILDYLPFIKCDFKWIILDEIHMMGHEEGYGMEMIIKALKDVPYLALSATIGNINELLEWFRSVNNNKVECVTCDKRFFNLQKYVYDSSVNKIVMINPLSMVSIDEFKDGSIINKLLNPTPNDIWSLVNNMITVKMELADLDPYKYFSKDERIELNKVNIYFNKLIEFLVNNFNKYENEIKHILDGYSQNDKKNYDIDIANDLTRLLFLLKEQDKCPSIIFQQNTINCLKIIRILSESIDKMENEKYPDLLEKRMKEQKKAKQMNKKLEKENKELTEKQEFKKMLETDKDIDIVVVDDINAPHPDFIFNIKDKFSSNLVAEWANKYKTYFPCVNGDYHYLIKLLWRGIGVYISGLPDNYLRLVQSLASTKKLAFVISDKSLVYGISMPFRTSVILNYEVDDLNSMMYNQMAGRAGRRGLDKEGNVIFVGFSWDRIKDLSISVIPNVIGFNRNVYTSCYANNLCKNVLDFESINNNMFNKLNFVNNHNFNLENIDINLSQLMWNLRESKDCIICSIIFIYMKRFFEHCDPNNEKEQIDIAYFLCKFIDLSSVDNLNNILPDVYNVKKICYEDIYVKLKNNNIEIPDYIDGRIWLSIRNNLLVDINNNNLRERLFLFSFKIKAIQHYCYHNKNIQLTRLLGKLLTRIWWIYHTSSPIIL
jgi:hypothetical protein